MKSSLVLFFFLISASIWGQNYCDPAQRPSALKDGGNFTIKGTVSGTSVGCVPLDISVESSDTAPYYIFDYKGGVPSTSNLTATKNYRYTKMGTFTIMQVVQGSSGGLIKCQTVEVLSAPNFKVQVCSGRKVQVTIADDSTTKGYSSFTVNFGAGINFPLSKANPTTSYVYPSTANTATISVVGATAGGASLGNCKKDTTIILNPANLAGVSIRKVTTRPDGGVEVLVKSSAGIKTDVQIDEGATGTFKNTGQTVTTTDTITIRNINTAQNQYCFRLSASDGCDNVATTSNVVCATHLDVVAQNQQNVLTWKEYPQSQASEFSNYQLYRDSKLLQSFSNRATRSYTDRDINCGNNYKYWVTFTLANGAEVISQITKVQAISDTKPAKVTNALVTVEENSILINSEHPKNSSNTLIPNYKTIISRAENGSNDFKEIATINNRTNYEDKLVNPVTQSYCYKIQFQNDCGNLSEPNEPICSINLYSKTNTTVDWTAESPFQADVQRYVLEIYDENDVLYNQKQLGGSTSFNPEKENPDQQQFKYRILAYSQNTPSFLSYSNYFVFVKGALVFIPDAFSPNKDSINDLFAVQGQFIETSRLIVYNRWGQPIYESDDAEKNGWNGQVDGQPAPEGSYIYRVEIKDSLGKNFVKVGTFLLVR